MSFFKNTLTKLIFISVTIFLTACGSTPQPTVSLDTNLFSKPDLKVGFVFNHQPKQATTHIYGAGCLLCYGVASALTSSLDTHLEATITDAEITKIKELVIAEYSERTPNIKTVELSVPVKKLKKFKGDLGFAKKDFRPLKEELNIDVLVVLDIYAHGAYRSFSNYIPNGNPQGFISGLLYAIDLDSNAYTQYLRIDEKVEPVGEWDEPKEFPSVTTSYYQAVENTKQKIRDAI